MQTLWILRHTNRAIRLLLFLMEEQSSAFGLNKEHINREIYVARLPTIW